MAKRELIETREIVYVNAPIAPILQGDSIHYEDIAFKSQIGRIHSFSEQDIVKPILDKISAEIEQNAYPIVHGVNNHELGMTLHGILQVIDKYKTEREE